MRKILHLAVLTVVVGVLTPSSLQAQGRVATIDLRKVFDDYYKTKAADASLKEEANELEKERNALREKHLMAQESYQTALDGANNQAISADERERRKKVAETRLLELRDLEGGITQFERQARSTLEERQRRKREMILGEIRSSITAMAKRRSLDMVIDTAAETINKTPVLIYSSGNNDITEAVLTELNASATSTGTGALPEN